MAADSARSVREASWLPRARAGGGRLADVAQKSQVIGDGPEWRNAASTRREWDSRQGGACRGRVDGYRDSSAVSSGIGSPSARGGNSGELNVSVACSCPSASLRQLSTNSKARGKRAAHQSSGRRVAYRSANLLRGTVSRFSRRPGHPASRGGGGPAALVFGAAARPGGLAT